MNIQQAMRAGPARVNDLFAKLAETSDGAVKTRDSLFAELKTELEQVAETEERHLLPLLAGNKETKDLVQGVTEGNKALREGLRALEAMPKNDPAFLRAVGDLRKGFQRHVRDGKSELLPAVQKVLSDAEAQQAADAILASAEKAEQAKQEAAEAARQEARDAREAARQEAAAQEAAEAARKESARAVRAASRQVAEGLSDGIRRGTESLQEGTARYMDGARDAAGSIRTMAVFSTATGRAMAAVQAAWSERLTASLSEAARASRRLMGCTSPGQIVEVQRELMETTLRGWVGCNERVLKASQGAVDEVLPALQAGEAPRRQAGNQGR